MNEQLKTQEIQCVRDQRLANDLSNQIYSLFSSYENFTNDDYVFEHNNDIFKTLCDKAKLSLELTNKKFDKEKLCYMIAVYVLKSGLYYTLERAYKNGFDFKDL
jgi:hypothetical protein